MAEERRIIVVGGGISGLTAAVEAAETGAEVIIVERNPYLGGRVAMLNQYFPKLCPPGCGLEINFKRLKSNPKISFHTMAEIDSVQGGPGDYKVTVKINPRYVNDNCTGCGACTEAAQTEIPNAFNYDMDTIKAAYLPHAMAYPFKYVIDPTIVGTPEGQAVADACKYNAVDLTMQPETITYDAGAVIWATGWEPYDATKMDYLGFGKLPNVITNVMFERMAAHNGPTGGMLLRPSDGKEIKSVAFIQCAGSRDENHLAYCSGICCLASLKQATYVKDKVADGKAYIYYIDIRATGKYEDFYTKVIQDTDIQLTKSKIARITPDPESGGVIIHGENITEGGMVHQVVDLAVLAVGMQPETATTKPNLEMEYDEFGFVTAPGASGIVPAGCVKAPMEVAASLQDATAAALRAIQRTKGR